MSPRLKAGGAAGCQGRHQAVGTPLRHILNQLGVADEPVPRVGEALRDQTVSRDAVVSGGELVVHVGYASPSFNPDPCIRCGWCAAACPTRIQPAGLLEASQRDDQALAARVPHAGRDARAVLESRHQRAVAAAHLGLRRNRQSQIA